MGFRLFLFLALTSLCLGQQVFWSGNDGDWFSAGSWLGALVPGVDGGITKAEISINGKYTVTISQNLFVNVPMTIGNPGATIMISIPPSVSVTFSANLTVSEGVTFNISDQSTLSINHVVINATNGVTVIGSGGLTFTGEVIFDGNLTSAVATNFSNLVKLRSGQITLNGGGSCSGAGAFAISSVLSLPVPSSITSTCAFPSTGGGGTLLIGANHTLTPSGGSFGVQNLAFESGVVCSFDSTTSANNIVVSGGAQITVATALSAARVDVSGGSTLTLHSGSINAAVVVGNASAGNIKFSNTSSLSINSLSLLANALAWVDPATTLTVANLYLTNFMSLVLPDEAVLNVSSKLVVTGNAGQMVNISGNGNFTAPLQLDGGVGLTISTSFFDSDELIVQNASSLIIYSKGSCSENGTIWLDSATKLQLFNSWDFAACFPQGNGSFHFSPQTIYQLELPQSDHFLSEIIFGGLANVSIPPSFTLAGVLTLTDEAQGWINATVWIDEIQVFGFATLVLESNTSLSNLTIGNVPFYPLVAVGLESNVAIAQVNLVSGKFQIDPNSTLELDVTNIYGGDFFIDDNSTLSMVDTEVDGTFASFSGPGQLIINESSKLTMNAFLGKLIISSGYFYLGGTLNIATGGSVSLAALGDCISPMTNHSTGVIHVVSAAELEVTGAFDFESCTLTGGSATLSYSSTLPITYSLAVTSPQITQIKVTNAATIILEPNFQIPSAVVDGEGTMIINGTHNFPNGVMVINGTLQLTEGSHLTGPVTVGTDGDIADYIPVLLAVNATTATVADVTVSGNGRIQTWDATLSVTNAVMNNGTVIEAFSPITFGTLQTNGSVTFVGSSLSVNTFNVLGGATYVNVSTFTPKTITLSADSTLKIGTGVTNGACQTVGSTFNLGSGTPPSKFVLMRPFNMNNCLPSGNGRIIYSPEVDKIQSFILPTGTLNVNSIETEGAADLSINGVILNGDAHVGGSSRWRVGQLTIDGHLQVKTGAQFVGLGQGQISAETANIEGVYRLEIGSASSTNILSVSGNVSLTGGTFVFAPTFKLSDKDFVVLKYGGYEGNFGSFTFDVTPPKNVTLIYSPTQLTVRDEHTSSASSLRPSLLLLALALFPFLF